MNSPETRVADVRLIERWMPIAALSEETARERRSMTALPPIYYLHVWWARRPLIASRAAILASLLPADTDRQRFVELLGIKGNPIKARMQIEKARRSGERLKNPYGYARAFSYQMTPEEWSWLKTLLREKLDSIAVLDPTAGGGSIPFEATRLKLSVLANDINPVAALIINATVKWPANHTRSVKERFDRIARKWRESVGERLTECFPEQESIDRVDQGYLWARTITCSYCAGMVPLSPNWKLNGEGTGIRLSPNLASGPDSPGRICTFEVVHKVSVHSRGTVSRGVATCPFSDCGRVIAGDEVKAQARAGTMGEQLYAVVYKERVPKFLKSGRRGKDRWERGYRAPRPEDDNSAWIAGRLAAKLPEWEALDMVPIEKIPVGYKTTEPQRYGMYDWHDLFSPRQLLCHGTSVEVFRELLEAERAAGALDESTKAAFGYLALALDTLMNYNSRMTRWISLRQVIASTFDRHDFGFVWSYAEMAPLVAGLGFDWAIRKTVKCMSELVALVRPEALEPRVTLFGSKPRGEADQPPISVTCKSGESLDHIADGTIDAVVMDPPYYDNVMYAELSDFFYVWLKRTAGYVYPELFRKYLTDKENEAVANPAKFRGQKGARVLAGHEYQDRMAAIFAECRRTLKADGIMTIMFTHKASGAWDALTLGLMEAGFVITASWPINTEAAGSLHIRGKAAARSTIFLVCRPRSPDRTGSGQFWEDIEPRVSWAVRNRVGEFQKAGITGVDLFLASFGPALEEFSRHWPLRRGTPRRELTPRRKLLADDRDPYEVTPGDALAAARREVKRWRLEQIVQLTGNADLDPVSAFFVLAWDTFRAPVFSYDEALQLARAVGVDLDSEITRRLATKKGSKLRLLDSTQRASKDVLGPPNGARSMLDALHHAAHLARTVSYAAAQAQLAKVDLLEDPRFLLTLQAVLEVLPPSKKHTGVTLTGDLLTASEDFEALDTLRRLYLSRKVDEPRQLRLWEDE